MYKCLILSLQVLYFYSCSSGGAGQDIDSILLSIRKSGNISHREEEGRFVYESEGQEEGRYLASFVTKKGDTQIEYISHGGRESDTLILKGCPIAIESKLDPLSIQVYATNHSKKDYVVLIGNAQSASGSGQQVRFFILVEIDKWQKPVKQYEFSSRFGSINCLDDFNGDGSLDYFKITKGNKAREFLLTVNNVRCGKKVFDGYILLEYELNDRFIIVKSSIPTR